MKRNPKYDLAQYDFLDLGCKNGGSIGYCAKRFRTGREKSDYAKGIGIDINPESVAQARAAGFDAIRQDILKLEIDHKFKFVTALDFLEHLPDFNEVEKMLKKMSELATDFLFIRHPSFDDVEYLKSFGLKITWTDWVGHTAMMKTYDLINMFNRLGLKQYCFIYKGDLVDSKNEFVVPLNAPVDSTRYSKELGRKKLIKFEKKVYSQIDIFVALRPIEPKRWSWITRES